MLRKSGLLFIAFAGFLVGAAFLYHYLTCLPVELALADWLHIKLHKCGGEHR